MAADFHHSESFLVGLMIVSALGVLSGLLCAGMRAHALRAMVLLGMLSACSAPTQGGGEAGGKARETPQERYFDQVYELVGKKWKLYHSQSPNDRAYGSLKVLFYVSPEGRVEQIRVKNNEATDSVLTRFTVKAIQDAKLPPMPAEVSPLIKDEREPELGMEFGILIRLKPRAEGGSAASSGMLMEKRWGLPPARDGRAKRGGVDEVSVNLTSKESGVRQMEKQQPSSTPTKEGSASGGTQTKVKLTSTPKERYTQRVTQAVEKKWRIYLKLQMEGVTYGSLKVNFYVNKQGKVEDPLVVDDKDSYRALTLLTLRAIKDAEIPPMPVDVFPLLPMNDPERLKIEYNVLIY